MWKYFFLSLLLAVNIQADNYDENLDDRILDDIFNDNIRRKCLKLGRDSVQMFDDAMSRRDECFRDLHKDLQKSKDELFTWVCSDNCMINFMKEVKVCLGSEEKYLPEFLYTSKEELCNDNGKVLKEKFKDFADAKCPESPIQMVIYLVSEMCTPKLLFMHHKSEPDFVLKRSDMCSDVKTYKSCALEIVKDCNSEALLRYTAAYFEPHVSWCEKNVFENDLE